MSQNLGTDFVVKIASLADDASIVEAFQYYHQGGLTGSPAPESIEHHLNQLAQVDIDIQNQIDTLRADIGLLQQEIGDSLAPTYVKMNPTSNSVLADANIINAPQGVIPLQIEGSAGTTEPLQQWRIGTDVVAEIRPDGSFATDDGNGNLVEIINNSTEQTLENKVIINSVLITDMETRSTSFTLGLAQQGKTIECNSSSAIDVSIPAESTTNFPIGSQWLLIQMGEGQVRLSPNAGVTLVGTPTLKLRAKYSACTLVKRASNSWVVMGDMATS